MIQLLEKLCTLDGTSGDERTVRDFIISEIKDSCEYSVDNLGNVIAFKKGKNTPLKKVMLDAHTDEVGLIITCITDDGFLRFSAVGGINTSAMMLRRVLINGSVQGVIGSKPVHLAKGEEGKKLPDVNSLYIDIGAASREEAEQRVSVGDRAVICGEFIKCGDKILAKALDDRIGCAILIKLLKQDAEWDFYATFTTQEEVGLRGARAAAYTVNPDSAIILEGTTAADIADTPFEKQVCVCSHGAAVSFMDGATVYDREYYNAALKSGILCQPKRAVAGGNNAGAVHLSRGGVRTLAISVPCRYIHTASSVADVTDIDSAYSLARYMLDKIAQGQL